MPPSPIRPMNSPWPIQSGQGGPSVEIARPRPIISEPQITVHLVPTLSAIRAHQDAAETRAKPGECAGERRDGAHAIHLRGDVLERDGRDPCGAECHQHRDERHRGDGPRCFGLDRGGRRLQHYEVPAAHSSGRPAQNLTTHIGVGLLCLLHCAKMRAGGFRGNFLWKRAPITKLTEAHCGIAFIDGSALCVVRGKPI